MKSKYKLALVAIMVMISVTVTLNLFSSQSSATIGFLQTENNGYRMGVSWDGDCCKCLYMPSMNCNVSDQCCNWFKEECSLEPCGLH